MTVYFEKNRGKWRARLSVNGKQTSLGMFDTKLKATRAFNKAKRIAEEVRTTPNRGGKIDGIHSNDFSDRFNVPYEVKSAYPKAFKPSLSDRAKRLWNKAKKSWS